MQAGSYNASGFAKLYRFDFARRNELVELGSPDADQVRRIIDPHANRIGGMSLLIHGFAPKGRSSRHEAGSAIHSLIADSCHPAECSPSLTERGKLPSAILRYRVERLRPVRSSTVLIRMMRSEIDIADSIE